MIYTIRSFILESSLEVGIINFIQTIILGILNQFRQPQ